MRKCDNWEKITVSDQCSCKSIPHDHYGIGLSPMCVVGETCHTDSHKLQPGGKCVETPWCAETAKKNFVLSQSASRKGVSSFSNNLDYLGVSGPNNCLCGYSQGDDQFPEGYHIICKLSKSEPKKANLCIRDADAARMNAQCACADTPADTCHYRVGVPSAITK